MVGADHLGPFKETKRKNLHILVLIDYLTKWLIAIPVPDVTTASVIRALRRDVIPQHGVMRRLITDKGSAFTSEEFAREMKELGVKHILATTERPQTNGLVERANRTVVSILKCFVNADHTDWDEHLPFATLCINTARQSSTKRTPFELVHGRTAVLSHQSSFSWPPTSPFSLHKFLRRLRRWRVSARKLILASQTKSKKRYDHLHRSAQTFRHGELVLVTRKAASKGKTKKLLPLFIGPFQIVRRKCQNTYLVEDPPFQRKRRVWLRFNAHVAQLQPFRVQKEIDWCSEEEEDASGVGVAADDEDHFVDVDRVVGGDPAAEFAEPECPPLSVDPLPGATRTTRSGRIIRRPEIYRDFVASIFIC